MIYLLVSFNADLIYSCISDVKSAVKMRPWSYGVSNRILMSASAFDKEITYEVLTLSI